MPPEHTSIGLLALLIVHLEANPYPAHLTRTSPLYSFYQCEAVRGPDFPTDLKEVLRESLESDEALEWAKEILLALKDGPPNHVLLGTTQAVDIIKGGVKVNALPEQASTLINQRIAIDR